VGTVNIVQQGLDLVFAKGAFHSKPKVQRSITFAYVKMRSMLMVVRNALAVEHWLTSF